MTGRAGCLAISLFAASLLAGPLAAQESESSVLSSAEVTKLVVDRSEEDAVRRSALNAFLEDPAIQTVAEEAGIDIRGVQSAAATLSDAEVAYLEPMWRDAEAALAGEGVITWIIIGLVVVGLIVILSAIF